MPDIRPLNLLSRSNVLITRASRQVTQVCQNDQPGGSLGFGKGTAVQNTVLPCNGAVGFRIVPQGNFATVNSANVNRNAVVPNGGATWAPVFPVALEIGASGIFRITDSSWRSLPVGCRSLRIVPSNDPTYYGTGIEQIALAGDFVVEFALTEAEMAYQLQREDATRSEMVWVNHSNITTTPNAQATPGFFVPDFVDHVRIEVSAAVNIQRWVRDAKDTDLTVGWRPAGVIVATATELAFDEDVLCHGAFVYYQQQAAAVLDVFFEVAY